MKPIWLASYPRSGNTLVRTILFHCFNLKTGSVYSQDFGENKKLEEYVGHIEQNADRSISFPEGNLPIIKTHALHKGDNSSIYIVRDGRAVAASFWQFTNPKVPMRNIIDGNHKFGKWSDHLDFWKPLSRPNTLLLRYEDILDDFENSLDKISVFLELEIISYDLPSRNQIAEDDGKWVRKKTDWRQVLTDEDLDRFNELNINYLKKFNYK